MSQYGNYTPRDRWYVSSSLRLYGMRFKGIDKDMEFYNAIENTIAYSSIKLNVATRDLIRTIFGKKLSRKLKV